MFSLNLFKYIEKKNCANDEDHSKLFIFFLFENIIT